jgi:hypothetical protein
MTTLIDGVAWPTLSDVSGGEFLNSSRPDEVFIPYRADGTPDHEATYGIVTALFF